MLDWEGLDPGKVERVAQILVRDACGATSIDGSGGDLAQDLRRDSPEGLTIFEVKSFTKPLTSSQKRQITQSCQRAVDLHNPRKWVLVIPRNPTPAEYAWFEGLRGKFPGVELEWYGRDWLDGQVAGRESLIGYVEGPEYKLLRRARHHEMERSALTSGADLTQRMDRLLRLGEDISPYWKWHFGDTPWGPGQILTPQRPEAASEDPVEFTPLFSFPADDPDAQRTSEHLDRVLRLGGDVEVPGRFIEAVRVAAASEATQRLLGEPVQQVSRLRLISIPDTSGLPMRGSLVLERPGRDGGPSVPFTFTARVGGSHGQTLTGVDSSGLLEGQFEMEANEDDVSGRLTLNLKPTAGAHPHEVLPAVRLLGTLQAGDNLHFRVGPVTRATFTVDGGGPEGMAYLHHIVAALELMQDHLGTLVPVPAEPLSDDEFRDLIDVARALTGERARLRYTGLAVELQPGAIRDFLGSVPDQPGVLYGTENAVAVTLDGVRYDVPGLAIWAPNVVLTNRAEIEAAAHGGAAVVATFASQEDAGIFLIRAVEDPGPQYRILDVG
ncbi:hypothetical protein ACI797_19165 [Geodermatophilus sp. SYSU D00691]